MNTSSEQKMLLEHLGFLPKENTTGVLVKQYSNHSDYIIEVNFEKQQFNFGNLIKAESKTTQNFSQAENWVVLECVDKLLTKGYKPKDITLEKVYPSGHGHSGRLDILVEKGGQAFLMIECKTYGKEYEKELNNLHKDGGQLFTYFQNDRNTSLLVLYTSKYDNNEVIYANTIVNIEPEYRETSNVKDFYERWNKLPKSNGVFDEWVRPYGFESKALTIDDLDEIKPEDSSFIFNRFLEILRHNVVSDKGNAFNRIFTLFLCKIYDEKINEGTTNELDFQWFESPFEYNGVHYEQDDHRSFQLRLTDLYKKGMHEFLEKVVTDFSETEFKNKFPHLSEDLRTPIIEEFRKVRLEKNNEFAIKDVYDEQSFEDNAVVVKEIVELLQSFKLRYTKKQQYLSDFFELLLTTGLKQESGQFFTPVPIAQYVIKSLPVDKLVEERLQNATIANKELLPYVMDYASGSGHFLTEMMHVIQSELDNKDDANYHKNIGKIIRRWQDDHFDWAIDYIYGIEKDYRLVKVGKVGCYLHGDGLANVIHSDGLARFGHPDYKGKLLKTDNTYPQENKQFDIIVSNPPYSVSAFKNVARKYYTEADYNIYDKLTEQSSEIECLFIERTKQLLKDGGMAGIILPSSILSNTGIYTKVRELILQYFDVLGITELGSNTFMATGTNTVVLFLRRRSNYVFDSLQKSASEVFDRRQDVTLNGIENAVSKYVAHVWETLSLTDYQTLLSNSPNKTVQQHEIYQEYQKKLTVKTKDKEKQQAELLTKVLELEKEKLLYFVLSYSQKVVIVKTGNKKAEKQFLGYEFSNRRGSEGIHPIQRGKEIHECTKLFDEYGFTNPNKASTYNYLAFANDEFNADIPDKLKENISYQNLVDMLTFDRADFEKNISLNAKKKIILETKWDSELLDNLVSFQSGLWEGKKGNLKKVKVLRNTNFRLNNGRLSYDDIAEINVEERQLKTRILDFADIILEKSGGSESQAIGRVVLFDKQDDDIYSYSNFCSRIRVLNKDKVNPIYLWLILHKFYKSGGTKNLQNGVRLLNIDLTGYKKTKIPLPPLNIQQKIIDEIEVLEKEEEVANTLLLKHNNNINTLLSSLRHSSSDGIRLSNADVFEVKIGKRVLKSEIQPQGKYPVYSANVFEPFGYIDKALITDFSKPSVIWGIDGDWMVNLLPSHHPFYPTDHCGYLRIKKPVIEAKYLAYCLEKEGIKIGFSRTKRASIDRVEGIKIPLPSISEQQKIVAEIEKIEAEIAQLEIQLNDIPIQKEAVLRKYL